MFKEAYWRNDGNIKKAMEELKEAVDDYCGKFWRDVYDSNSDDFWFAIGDSKYRKVFEDATPKQKQDLTLQQKRKVWQLIEYESMEEIEDFLMIRMQEKIYKQLYKNPLLKEYNKDLSFTIQEDLGDESGQARYAGRTICLGSAGKPFKDWYYNIPDDALDIGWDTKFIPCTYLGYMKMGMPDQVLVYPSVEAMLGGAEPMETIGFEPDLKKGYTVVELARKKSVIPEEIIRLLAPYGGIGKVIPDLKGDVSKVTKCYITQRPEPGVAKHYDIRVNYAGKECRLVLHYWADGKTPYRCMFMPGNGGQPVEFLPGEEE